jgi:hypothetical protein
MLPRKTSTVMTSSPVIDLAYAWVNRVDPDFRVLCREYTNRLQALNPERFRGTHSMLKYSLRSVDLFLPWIRNVYIVTCRPQIPPWLRVEHPRAKVIYHDEVIDSCYLPTFDCNVMESGLHQIAGSPGYLSVSVVLSLAASPCCRIRTSRSGSRCDVPTVSSL